MGGETKNDEAEGGLNGGGGREREREGTGGIGSANQVDGCSLFFLPGRWSSAARLLSSGGWKRWTSS